MHSMRLRLSGKSEEMALIGCWNFAGNPSAHNLGSNVVKAKPYFEMTLAAVLAALAVATSIWPIWIENLTGLEPDAGSGQVERIIVAVFAILSVLALTVSRRDFRRASAESTA